MSRLIAFAVLLALNPCWADDAEKVTSAEPVTESQPAGDCLTETGSRIRRDAAEHPCIGAPGQVLSRKDLDRTGAVNTADAVRKLVPQAR